MKKFYYSLFAAASMMLAVTSCSQEEDFVQSSSEMTTFSVSLNGVTGSRTTGDGTTATKLYYQAYRGDELVINKNVDINTTTKIDMSLLKGETYDIIFWAQAPDATFYQIDDLRSISIDYKTAALKANQESYDAFYNALNDFTSDAKTHTIELRRPFAKLNLGTSDWNTVETDAATNPNETDPVTHTSVTVKGLANTLNTLTGEATGDEDVTFSLSEIPTDFFTLNNVSYKRLSLNYLLVPNSKAPQGLGEYQAEGEDGKANVDLAFALNRGDKQLFTIEVPNAPVQRNWRTNVVGELLTGSKFDVIIKPDTDDDYNTLEILEEVLTKGGEVTLYSNSRLAEDITIPEGVTVKINLNEKTLSLNEVGIKVEGSLILTDGNIDVKGQNSIGLLLWNDNNTTSLDINDVVINVTDGAAAIVPYQNGTAEINFRNSKMNVNQGLGGIYGAFWADELKVNLYNSTIEGKNGLYINAKNAEVLMDDKSSASEFNMTGGNLLVTYGGDKPEVKDVNSSSPSVITYKKMGATNYEGIYTVDGANKEYNVTSAEGILNLHKLMAEITTGEGQGATINLTTDIDLKNEPFTPIDRMWVTFNGNGHTIKNLYVPKTWKAGFFGYLGGGSINDLTIENANVTGAQVGIFAGAVEGTINNCFLKGTNTVTWAACYQYNDPSSSLEVWNGIGAITGVLQPSTVNAVIEAGTIVTLNKTGFTTDSQCNFVDNLTGYIGENKGKVTNNGSVIVPYTVSSTDNLTDVLSLGANNITLPEGQYTLPSLSATEGVTIIGKQDGSTIIGGDNATNGFGSNFGKNTTIKNVTFSGSTNGVRYSYANGGTTTFENCTFAGNSTYGFHIDQSNDATFIFNNCTFSGFNAFAGDLVSVTFNNCTFKNNGNYGHTNIWSVAYFNNCTWGDNTSVGQGTDSNATLYFNNIEESYHHEFIGSAESLFAFAKSVNEGGDSWKGQKIVLVKDIDLNNEAWTPIGQTGATQFKGIFDGQNHTIKNLKVDSSSQTGKNYSSGLFGWAESGVTIQNVKVDGATVTGNHNVAVIVGYTYSGKIENCHVSNATITCNHANDDACGDKCGLIAGYAGDESRFTNCSGKKSTVKAGRDAGQLIGCGYNVSVSKCSATDVEVSATGECTGANVNKNIIGRVMG